MEAESLLITNSALFSQLVAAFANCSQIHVQIISTAQFLKVGILGTVKLNRQFLKDIIAFYFSFILANRIRKDIEITWTKY